MMNPYGCSPLREHFLFFLLAIGVGAVLLAIPVRAAERPLPEDIQPGLTYLLALNENPQAKTVAPDELKPLIEFILQNKAAGDRYSSTADRLPEPMVYHQFDLAQSLATIVRYAFHPVIPSHVLALSSIRHSYWKKVNGQSQPLPANLAGRLADPDSSLVIHGIEHEEIAPDLFSGAYYSYDLARTLIMCRVAGHTVWISLARQRDRSDVGRKGVVLGADDGWNYLYTGEKGINRMGLGWVDSYMYEAFSAIVYVQTDGARPLVRCGIFKWLRAGWNDMNFVRQSHIRRGLERYADTFREIIEAPQLPAPGQIAAAAQAIGRMSLAQLQDGGRRHLQALKARYGSEKQFPDQWYAQTVENGAYLEQMTRPQLEAILFLDYMKKALGRDPVQASHLARRPPPSERPLP